MTCPNAAAPEKTLADQPIVGAKQFKVHISRCLVGGNGINLIADCLQEPHPAAQIYGGTSGNNGRGVDTLALVTEIQLEASIRKLLHQALHLGFLRALSL